MTRRVDQEIKKKLLWEQGVLLEDEAKTLLKVYGIPVVPEQRVKDPEEAVGAASDLGYPVVLKGLGEKMTHKTEMGMVRVGLADDIQVRAAAEEMRKRGGDDLAAFLIQPVIQGRRELMAGLFRDPQFGPVVMLGLGGVFTEALEDVVFRLAPLDENDIHQMMDELDSKAILGPFRGERAVDTEALSRVLMGLSDLALDYPGVGEVDINPLIITPEGGIMAVDALVILRKNVEEKGTKRPPVDKRALGEIFYPESVAFVGASAGIGKWGHMLLTNCLSGNYGGRIHLVNPRGGEITGRKVYTSLDEIPGKVDLAVVTIPARGVMALIPQLKEKGVRGMLLITSGFGETGEEGLALEKELVREAARAGIIVLGPNTMGICNPHKQFFCNGAHVHPVPGSTALVCQSGNMGTQLLAFAEQHNIGIRAFSGSGNEAMVTIEDYMEAFELDDKTRTVVLYLESVKDGRRFFESARRVSRKKPVVVLKGGRTKAGGRAASSHTGAMASDTRVFDAACRQAGIIQVYQPVELLDLSALFSSLPLPRGNRVAVMTLGGGWGVVTADLCMENGLVLPDLSQDIIQRLDAILPDYWSRGNPVDIVGENDPNISRVAVEELLKWDGCDAVIHLGIHGKRIFVNKMMDSIAMTDPAYTRQSLDELQDGLCQFEEDYIEHVVKLTEIYQKPVLGVSLLTDEKSHMVYRIEGCTHKGIFFPSPERAVKALAGMYRYGRWLGHAEPASSQIHHQIL